MYIIYLRAKEVLEVVVQFSVLSSQRAPHNCLVYMRTLLDLLSAPPRATDLVVVLNLFERARPMRCL